MSAQGGAAAAAASSSKHLRGAHEHKVIPVNQAVAVLVNLPYDILHLGGGVTNKKAAGVRAAEQAAGHLAVAVVCSLCKA